MEKLRDILVTDRSQADVLAGNARGHYNAEDLNRVLRACSWLAGRLEGCGYSVPGEFFPAVLVHVKVQPPYSGRAESVLAYRGETVTVGAAAEKGCKFRRWEENGQTVSEAEHYSFPAEADRELAAVFDVPAAEDAGIAGLAVAGRAVVGKGIG